MRKPPLRLRLMIAVAVASAAAFLSYLEPLRKGGDEGDFNMIRFGAKTIIEHGDPYQLVGPGRVYNKDFALLYPATALVVALPFGLLSEQASAIVFMWLSVFALAFALTADGLYRTPLFLSSAFVIAARRGQWTPVFTAAMLLPNLAWIYVCKPNIGIALLASSSTWRAVKTVILGGGIIVVVSLILLPSWPREWLNLVSTGHHGLAPITQRFGFVIALALLRWRRPEARLLLALGCVPHTPSWYHVLPLLLIPSSFRESLILSLLISSGFVYELFSPITATNIMDVYHRVSNDMILFAYLPALIMILRRPNERGGTWRLPEYRVPANAPA
ncbi:MAG TPA: hypothetical protein VIF83_09155 [Gemmatimonadaceae bacterium]